MCFGRGNPIAGLECAKKVVHGTEFCLVHQPGYVRPGKPVPLAEVISELRERLQRIEDEWTAHGGAEGIADCVRAGNDAPLKNMEAEITRKDGRT